MLALLSISAIVNKFIFAVAACIGLTPHTPLVVVCPQLSKGSEP